VTATGIGVENVRNLMTIVSSAIRLTAASGYGIYVDPEIGANPTVNADGVTIVGPSLSDTYGAMVDTFLRPAQSADINLTNSVIRGFSAPLDVYAQGTGQGKIAASYADYDPTGNTTSGANASITEANVSNVGDAGFVDPAGGDYHLLASSPLVDTGDPATAQGLDLDGNPLVIGRRDEGAFELQPPAADGGQPAAAGSVQGTTPATTATPAAPAADTQPPTVTGFRANRRLFAVSRGTHFRYTLSEPAQITLKIQRALAGHRYRTIGTLARSAKQGANSTRFSGRIGKRALGPGSYRAVISAIDAASNRSTPQAARFRIAASSRA
jgi:hypothetical protein